MRKGRKYVTVNAPARGVNGGRKFTVTYLFAGARLCLLVPHDIGGM